jgi:hypothetical protein
MVLLLRPLTISSMGTGTGYRIPGLLISLHLERPEGGKFMVGAAAFICIEIAPRKQIIRFPPADPGRPSDREAKSTVATLYP